MNVNSYIQIFLAYVLQSLVLDGSLQLQMILQSWIFFNRITEYHLMTEAIGLEDMAMKHWSLKVSLQVPI